MWEAAALKQHGGTGRRCTSYRGAPPHLHVWQHLSSCLHHARAQVRQPWADVALKPAVPTAEQLEWLEKEGFIRDEEEEAEGAEGEEGGEGKPKRRVRAWGLQLRCLCGQPNAWVLVSCSAGLFPQWMHVVVACGRRVQVWEQADWGLNHHSCACFPRCSLAAAQTGKPLLAVLH